jgi:hypothetical protein
MWFKRCSVAGILYLEDRGRMLQLLADGDERNSIIVDTFTVSRSLFPVTICVCFVYSNTSLLRHTEGLKGVRTVAIKKRSKISREEPV